MVHVRRPFTPSLGPPCSAMRHATRLRSARWCRRGLATQAKPDSPATAPDAKKTNKPPRKKSPRPSEDSKLAQLMYHPLLFDPLRKPRLPIVLCHGLYGFDVRGPFFGLEYQYWSAALDVLRKRIGADVLVHGVPPTGSIKERAESLHEFLCSPASGARGERLNFIGHSMGGLDARYIISRIQPTEYTPASLTTLATPHRGSPFMDWCNANIGIGLELIDKMMHEQGPGAKMPPVPPPPYSLKEPLLRRKEEAKERVKEASGSVPGMTTLTRALTSVSSTLSSYILSIFDQPAYAMLSTKYMTRLFNPRMRDDPSVRYFSVAARSREISIFHPLWLPKLILDKAAEADTSGAQYDGSSKNLHGKLHGNDGLVSVGSAVWGEMLGIMEDWDHWDMRGPGGPHRIRPTSKPKQAKPPPPPTLGARIEAIRGTLASWFSWKKKPEVPQQQTDEAHWNWRDAVLSDHKDTTEGPDADPPPLEAAAYALTSSRNKHGTPSTEQELAQHIADWIASHLPTKQLPHKPNEQHDTNMLMTYLSQPANSGDGQTKTPDVEALKDKDWFQKLGNSPTAQALRRQLGWIEEKKPTAASPSSAALFAMSVLEMFPFLLNHHEVVPNTPSNDVFERFWIALCRNLYDEGL